MLFGGGGMQFAAVKRPWLLVVGSDAVKRAGAIRTLSLAAAEHLQFDDLAHTPGNALVTPAVVMMVAGEDHWSPVAAVRSFRQSDIATPLMLWLPSLPTGRQRLSVFARAGFDDLLVGDQTSSMSTVRALKRRVDLALPPKVIQEFGHVSQEQVIQQVVGFVLRNSFRKLAVKSIADWFGFWPETLNRKARQAGLPTLRKMVALGRLLYVAHQLESGQKIKHIASRLGFSSSSDMGMFVIRWTGAAPRAVRDSGGLAVALQQVRLVLGAPERG